MGAISERLEITLAEVKEFLREGEVVPFDPNDEPLTDPGDLILQIMIDAAKEAADDYCNNPFLKANGDPMPIPAKIKLWCLRWIYRQNANRALGLAQEQIAGIGTMTWAPVDKSDLWPYRKNPGL